MGAIYWARPDKVYFANTKAEAARIGFDDQFIYDELSLPLADRRIPLIHIPSNEAIGVFRSWETKLDKTSY
jgi:tRNA(Arg) A34 adenosine deaminase TadA